MQDFMEYFYTHEFHNYVSSKITIYCIYVGKTVWNATFFFEDDDCINQNIHEVARSTATMS